MKKRIAVIFGGRSPEHDVSIVTGLQALQAIDSTRFEAFPVYITTTGRWLTGEALRDRANYLPTRDQEKALIEVVPDISPQQPGSRKGVLLKKKRGMFGSAVAEEFDVVLPAFHGLIGEDGNIQGIFETAGVSYVGMRTMASAILMDKVLTKHILRSLEIPVLPHVRLKRGEEGYTLPLQEIEELMSGIGCYPAILKPAHLGSSIGVAKVNNAQEVRECLPAIFQYDDAAIAEPFVENLVEYNVSVSKITGTIQTSAIERPKAAEELLDFKQKYLSGGDNKTGDKVPGDISEGMLSLTRELNPALDSQMEKNIRLWAGRLFDTIDGTGAPRIDFIGNAVTGEIWMNEVNPCPGSFGYFLWEAGSNPILFTHFLSLLIEEALAESKKSALPADPVPMDARLHRRHT